MTDIGWTLILCENFNSTVYCIKNRERKVEFIIFIILYIDFSAVLVFSTWLQH